NHFGIKKHGKTIVHRLLSLGKRLIEQNEKKFGIPIDESKTFEYRIGHLRHSILDHVAYTAGIKKYNKDANAIDKLRTILSTFEMVQVGAPDPKKELPSLELATWGRNYCQIVYDFIAIHPSYLSEYPSPERIYEWIYKFENELFGSFKPRPTRAYISFTEPLYLSKKYKEYKSSTNKKEIADKLTGEMRDKIQELLDAEKRKSYLLFEPDFTF
ncbi:MAG: 1-acyl-sn-glycerol-3-phosphate acyltransferase, partial [Leptospiraceae bacterium]|nr:1-acyl-sn-glycerol-3-phosphate acyltransferase [Leptospiraceae bacterium]